MTRVSLSDAGDYHLVNDEQDLRGRAVVDGTGQPLGTVEAMLLDTEQELVTTLVLDDGTEIPVKDVTLGDDVVYHNGSAADGAPAGSGRPGTDVFADGGRVVRRDRASATDDAATGDAATDDAGVHDAGVHDAGVHDADRQAHFQSAYGTSGRTVAQMQPAYDYGHTASASYAGDFDTHEAEMRSDYESRNAGSAWEDVKDAVRHGFDKAKHAVS